MKLLFCGGYNRTTLSAVRSLGRKGHVIDLAVSLSPNKFRIARWFASRFSRRQFCVPHPLKQAHEFREQLMRIVRKGGYDAIMPFDQRMAAWFSLWKDELSAHAAVVAPDWPVFEQVHDKARLHRLLADHGFVVPRQYRYQDLDDLCQQDLCFPLVVKPRRAAGALGLRYAANRAELAAAYHEVSAFHCHHPEIEDYRWPLVQEYIPGPICDANFLCRRGEVRASMTVERCTTYPITGGITVQAATTADQKLLDYCRPMVELLGFDGPCDVEVKRDERDGNYKLLEINPRIWGALELSIRAGIDFTEKACELAVTGDTAPQTDYRVGTRHWILGRELMAIHQDRGNRWRRLRALTGLRHPDVVTGLDWTDWKPELAALVSTVRLFTNRRQLLLPVGRTFSVEECRRLGSRDRAA